MIHLPQHLLQFEFSHPPMGERAGSRLQTQHDRWIDNTAQQPNILALPPSRSHSVKKSHRNG